MLIKFKTKELREVIPTSFSDKSDIYYGFKNHFEEVWVDHEIDIDKEQFMALYKMCLGET